MQKKALEEVFNHFANHSSLIEDYSSLISSIKKAYFDSDYPVSEPYDDYSMGDFFHDLEIVFDNATHYKDYKTLLPFLGVNTFKLSEEQYPYYIKKIISIIPKTNYWNNLSFDQKKQTEGMLYHIKSIIESQIKKP